MRRGASLRASPITSLFSSLRTHYSHTRCTQAVLYVGCSLRREVGHRSKSASYERYASAIGVVPLGFFAFCMGNCQTATNEESCPCGTSLGLCSRRRSWG